MAGHLLAKADVPDNLRQSESLAGLGGCVWIAMWWHLWEMRYLQLH